MISARKKREWFDRGAASFAIIRPGQFDEPTYPCPLCLTPFTINSLADGGLSAEHVPPKSFGGHELLLTCTRCNNTSGTKLDADAKKKEDVALAMAGRADRPHRIKVMIGDLQVNGQLHAANGTYSLQIPKKLNKPGTSERLQQLGQVGTKLTVEHERFAELGAKISWLRSGYLALVAVAGYQLVLDPAMEIVRRQILENDGRLMVTFTFEVNRDIPFSERRILQALAPEWDRGWAVQFGRYLVRFPSLGDMEFYNRLAANVSTSIARESSFQSFEWPREPTFGLPDAKPIRGYD
ncbi:MAG TPA: HNH endonuclease [Bryobacteraceae bacterium]|jgi:hypothetical protein|nr:HNH endonuclease [Bryobacteraceae bacterium]